MLRRYFKNTIGWFFNVWFYKLKKTHDSYVRQTSQTVILQYVFLKYFLFFNILFKCGKISSIVISITLLILGGGRCIWLVIL